MPATPASTLLDEAKCYACYGNSMTDLLKLALLDRIAQGGSPTPAGGGNVTSGVGPPGAAPATSPAIYINESDGTIYSYYGSAWH